MVYNDKMKTFKQAFYSFGDFAKKYTFIKKDIRQNDLKEYRDSIEKILSITKNKYEGGIINFSDGAKSEFFTSYKENSVAIPEKYIDKLKDSVFVHNHPNGTAPSLRDISEIIVNEMKGVVVTSNHYNYKFIIDRVDIEHLKKNVKIAIKQKNEIFKTAIEKENISKEELEFNEMHYIMSFIADNVKGVYYGRY